MNPMMVAQNRTARLAAEAATPVYSTDTVSAARAARTRMIVWSLDYCGPEFCFVCSRATDHYGEHSDDQLVAFYHGKGRRFRR